MGIGLSFSCMAFTFLPSKVWDHHANNVWIRLCLKIMISHLYILQVHPWSTYITDHSLLWYLLYRVQQGTRQFVSLNRNVIVCGICCIITLTVFFCLTLSFYINSPFPPSFIILLPLPLPLTFLVSFFFSLSVIKYSVIFKCTHILAVSI